MYGLWVSRSPSPTYLLYLASMMNSQDVSFWRIQEEEEEDGQIWLLLPFLFEAYQVTTTLEDSFFL